jgi:hypothetical protein
MSGKTMQRERKISSKLVHIEQVIDLAKSFKILTLASNRTEAKLVSDNNLMFWFLEWYFCVIYNLSGW